jgi:hypothetical protein
MLRHPEALLQIIVQCIKLRATYYGHWAWVGHFNHG